MLTLLFDAGLLFGVPLQLTAGQYLCRSGQPAANVYWLKRGRVTVQVGRGRRAPRHALDAPILLGAAHLLKTTCPLTVQAHSDCELQVLSRVDLWTQVQLNPQVRLYVLRCLSREATLTWPHFD